MNQKDKKLISKNRVLAFLIGITWAIFYAYLFLLNNYMIVEVDVGVILYFLSCFYLFSHLYSPYISEKPLRKIKYFLSVAFLQFFNLISSFVFLQLGIAYLLNYILLAVNFLIVTKKAWIVLDQRQSFYIKFESILKQKYHQKIRLYRILFISLSLLCILLNNIFLKLDLHKYAIGFGITGEISLVITYWFTSSSIKKKWDKFLDIVILVSITLAGLYLSLIIDILNILNSVFAIFVHLIWLICVYRFVNRTYAPNEVKLWFKLHPDHKVQESSSTPVSSNQNSFNCQNCNNNFQLPISINAILNGKRQIFCPYCGNQIPWYENIDFDADWLIKEHEVLIHKLDKIKAAQSNNDTETT